MPVSIEQHQADLPIEKNKSSDIEENTIPVKEHTKEDGYDDFVEKRVIAGKVLKSLKRPFKVGSMEFAPVMVPFERRKQTLAVLLWSLIMPSCMFLSFLCIRASGPILVIFMLYVSWMLFVQNSHVTGGRPSKFMRSLSIWSWFRDYFPINLIKTAEISPDKTYIFGYHPHGIIGLGAFCNFATEATKFSEKFPGINLRLLTLNSNFHIPFYGPFLSSLGMCDASKESCNYILSQGPGNALMLVLGGAKEALDAHPGQYILTLNRRKGFIKIALRNGSSLVPVFSFGENSAYQQLANPRGSMLRKFQNAMQKKMGFSMPIILGRGVFTYSHGILPNRGLITSVVGEPIDVPKMTEEEITSEVIDKYHKMYVDALSNLFEEHKDKYGDEGTELTFL